MLTKESPALYGLMAEFDTPEQLMTAAALARDAGYKNVDAFSPFPVEGLSASLGFKDKFIPILMLCGAGVGLFIGFFMQVFGLGWSYPLNIGGRPIWSWPNYIPIAFECTILFCAWTGVISMFALNGLPQPYHPVFNVPNFDRASTDKFFLLIEAKDAKFDLSRTKQLLQNTETVQVTEIQVER